nr:hypothetical protein [Tanacetum cinerariifolium]
MESRAKSTLTDDNCTVEFDAFGFSVKYFLTHHILLRCDSSGDLYPVTSPSPTTHVLLSVSPNTWHQCLGHLDEDVLCSCMSHPNWRDAMYDEYNALIKNSTWVLVLKLPNVNVHIHQLDVKNAFLNDDLYETMYMYQPPGYAYKVGFSSSRCDSSLFIYQHGSEVAYLLIYVDDIVLTASSTDLLQRMFLSQKKYAFELLDRAHMANCNPTRTPVDTESKLGSDGDPISDPTLYRNLAGALKRVLRYVRGTLDFGLQLYASITAKWQHTLSRSTAEAEYN